MKLFCHSCLKPCKDEAVKFGDKYYHLNCFSCKECGLQLSTTDFYTRDEYIYCQDDYVALYGTKCKSCQKYIEGEVFTALGFVFHKDCFKCSSCCKALQTGSKVTFVMKNFLCTDCFDDDGLIEQDVLETNEAKNETNDCSQVEKVPTKDEKNVESGFGKFYNLSYLERTTSPMKKVSSINTSESSPRHYHRPENFSYTQVAKDFIKPPQKESSIILNDLESEIAFISKATRIPANGMIGLAPMSNREPVRLAKLPDAHLKVKVEDGNGVVEENIVEDGIMEISYEKSDKEKGLICEEDVDGDDKDVGDDDDDDVGTETEGAVGFNKEIKIQPSLNNLWNIGFNEVITS